MNYKRIATLLLVVIAAAMLILAISPGIAFEVSGTGGGTPAPSGSSAPAATGGSVSDGTTSAGGTSSGTTTQTGADLILFTLAGAGLLSCGYFLTRKSKA